MPGNQKTAKRNPVISRSRTNENQFKTKMPLVTNIISQVGQDPDSLYQDPVPLQDVASEKPWHRLAIMLAAKGCTVTEIAEKLERSISWVSLLLRQPWARERLTSELMAEGRDELSVLIKGASAEAFKRVMYLSEAAENEAVRLAANREILDRHLGKPVAKVNQEIKALEAEERRLLGGRTSEASQVIPGSSDSDSSDTLNGDTKQESLSA